MKLIIVCALALAYTLPCVLGIFRGKKAAIEKFSYQARIEVFFTTGGKRNCGASLIAADWLLTAAHCVYGAYNATVHLGTTRRYYGAFARGLRSRKIIIHTYYNHSILENDIALINIPAVTLNKRKGFVELPKMDAVNSDYVNENVIASGWGRMGNTEPAPDKLQFTTLKVLSNRICRENFAIRSGMLCATGDDYSSPCEGDSGAPLVLTNTKTQVGIMSWGSRHGCQRGLPAVFTRITHYLQWIKEESGVFYQ